MAIKNIPSKPQPAAPIELPTVAWLQPVLLPLSAYSEFAHNLDESLRELEDRHWPRSPQGEPSEIGPSQIEPSYGAIKRNRRPR